MPSNKKLLQAAAGNAGESLYVEDVFSTYLYTGTGSDRTVTNDIDLSGEGGLVWIKNRDRSTGTNHVVFDTERGTNKELHTNTTEAEDTAGSSLSAFNADGFDIDGFSDNLNSSDAGANQYTSWTFRKAEKFFDIVTYSGTGSGIKVIDHNLGSAPAVIFVKKTNSSQDWLVFSKDTSQPHNKYLKLNTTDAELNYDNIWGENGYLPTDTQFKVQHLANESSSTYVAYLFASDAGGYGDDGTENIIKCGSFVPASTWQSVINIGFEPQFILYKKATSTGDWYIHDNMRGIFTGSADPVLSPNKSDAEINYIDSFNLHANGFEQTFSSVDTNTYIYIAIRRPMKTPEAGTEVFNVDYRGNGSVEPGYVSGFVTDLAIRNYTPGGSSQYPQVSSRLTGGAYLLSSSTAAQSAVQSNLNWDYMNGYYDPASSNSTTPAWMFKRATGFMDVVAYTGDGANSASPLTINHGLNSTPDMILAKQRTDAGTNWFVYHSSLGVNSFALLNLTNAAFGYNGGFDNITSTSFDVFDSNATNGKQFVAYLFATLAGVSKVGSVAHSGTTNVDCGFSAGARFVLVKRTDSSGDWYVWDSVRGIVAGNDPYLLLNSTAAEVTNTDYIDPLSSGFTLTSSFTAGTYIFLAIA